MFYTYFEYHFFYIIIMTMVSFIGVMSINYDSSLKKREAGVNFFAFCFALFVIIGSGLRRTDGGGFGDTTAYVHFFYEFASWPTFNDFEGEWLWNFSMFVVSKIGDVSLFFLIVAILYVSCHIIACYKMAEQRCDLLLIGCLCAYSFLSYSSNGIRNGLACALVILAISYVVDYKSKKDLIITILLSFCAYNIHHSAALPIAAMLVCHFFKDTKKLIIFWFLSIPISLVAGSQVEAFFGGLGFDDRMSAYSQDHEYDYMFSHTGFRWDFLLYSFMPILLGYYIVFKQEIKDNKYSFFLNTYILCNAFWVMVIRTTCSNRFAYLSWFLYPIVLIYPLVSFRVFNQNNDRKVAYIILGHSLFSFGMWLLGK